MLLYPVSGNTRGSVQALKSEFKAYCFCGPLAVLLTLMKPPFTVSEAEHGMRLDRFVSRTAGCGLHAAKRLAAAGAVLVDGKSRPAHCKLPAGSVVVVHAMPVAEPEIPVELAAATEDYLAFVKPAGLHSVRIAGGSAPSLEEAVSARWQSLRETLSGEPVRLPSLPDGLLAALGGPSAEYPPCRASLPGDPPILVSRLDEGTSGLVLAAAAPGAEARFREMEAAGLVGKYYLAVVHGNVPGPFSVTRALDTAKRKKTRVLAGDSPDPTRRTLVSPVETGGEFFIRNMMPDTTLVAVRILRGARHQIRAHLAHAGFPILGDALYGPEGGNASLHLHHARLIFPGFSAFCPPSWLSGNKNPHESECPLLL